MTYRELEKYRLFSDIPNNAVFKWKENGGVSLFFGLLVQVEEVLGGLDEVNVALEQAVMMVHAIAKELHADLGPHLPAALTHELLYPLQSRMAFVERLQDELAAVS